MRCLRGSLHEAWKPHSSTSWACVQVREVMVEASKRADPWPGVVAGCSQWDPV